MSVKKNHFRFSVRRMIPSAAAVLFFAAIGILPFNAEALPKTVQIDSGAVSGIQGANQSVTIFKGIPYAAPPTGDLRWKPPMQPAKWTGVLKADHFCSSCAQQTMGAYSTEFGHRVHG